MELQEIKLVEVMKGFILLPGRWVVERGFGWATRFRRLARDYERLPETLAELTYLVSTILMVKNFIPLMTKIQ